MGEFNVEEFEKVCKATGLKMSALASKFDMPDTTFRAKRKGRSEWKRSEMNKAKTVLNLSTAQFNKIFCFNGR